jgi:hypothetical protein
MAYAQKLYPQILKTTDLIKVNILRAEFITLSDDGSRFNL